MAPIILNKNGVSLYLRSKEHLPPHIHAVSGDDDAMIDIRTGEVIKGEIEGKKLQIVQDWLKKGENRKAAEEEFYRLNPSLRLGSRSKSHRTKKQKNGKE